MSNVKNENNSLQLQSIKGVGNKLSSKILKEVGGEDNLKRIVDNLELENLISIDGISQRKAIEIMNELLGNPKQNFLKNEKAFQLYDEIIEKILSYSNTDYSKNRILLISPLKDEEEINNRLNFVMDAKKVVSDLPIIKLRGLMKNLTEPKEFELTYDSSKLIVVESEEDNQYLTELGLNQYYPIVTAVNSPEFAEELHNYELIFYIYSNGTLDFGELNNLIMISKESSINEIIPDKIIGYFNKNRFLFSQVSQIRKILNKETVLNDIDSILDSINLVEKENIDFDEILSKVKSYGDDRLKNEIKKVDLEGDEILDLLNHEMPSKLDKIFNNILNELSEMVYKKTSIKFNPFLERYPLEIDDNEVYRIKQDLNSKVENNLFDMKIKVAKYLSSIKDKAYDEVMEIIKFDYMFTLGSFAYEYDLHRPYISNDFKLEGAIHLNLALKDSNKVQRINYELTEDDNIALLTGANSGGKTTLLETISQVSIMTQMGLPVACNHAEVPIFDELYHFSKKRSLDAGAFESFLRVFIPIVTTDSKKLVLLDELEGITELDASVKIISSFIDLIKKTDSFAVIVTHMAKELINYTDIRVDGIEAKGLDENYELIVDRTPKMNYLARSTPELILKRIYENSNGCLKEVYGEILKKFE